MQDRMKKIVLSCKLCMFRDLSDTKTVPTILTSSFRSIKPILYSLVLNKPRCFPLNSLGALA